MNLEANRGGASISPKSLCRPWSPIRLNEYARVTIVRGEGWTVWDSEGRSYLDAKSGNLSVSCGYSCEPILEAMREQLSRIPVFDTIGFDVDITDEYTEALASAFPEGIERVFLANSGSEAAECAVVIARAVADANSEPERRTILRLDRGYHGTTPSAMSASALIGNQRHTSDEAPGFESVGSTDWSSLDAALQPFKDALNGERGRRVAAVLVEPVLGIAGVVVPPSGYLSGVAQLAAAAGALLIVDEVLTGMGRTGRLFGVENEAVYPDIILASKGLTSGYVPLSAVGMSGEVYERLASDPVIHGLRYGHTSSGHPLACAAGLAALRFTISADLPGKAAVQGARLLRDLEPLRETSSVVDVRGVGMLIGIELDSTEATDRWVGKLLESGVIVRSQGRVITLAPPLVIDSDGCDSVVERILSLR